MGLKELNTFVLHLSKYYRLRMKRTLSRVLFRLDKCLLIQLILLPILSYIYFSKSRTRIQVNFIKHSVLIRIIGGIVNSSAIRFCEAIGWVKEDPISNFWERREHQRPSDRFWSVFFYMFVMFWLKSDKLVIYPKPTLKNNFQTWGKK